MKIVHITPELAVGGVTTLVADLLPALQAVGAEVELWHFGRSTDVTSIGFDGSFQVRNLGERRGSFLQRIRKFVGHVDESDADIFHSHAPPEEVLVGLVYCKVPSIGHIHRAPTPELYDASPFTRLGIARRVIRPLTFRRLDLVIACSEAARDFATRAYGLAPEQQLVIRNAVDLKRVRRIEAGREHQGASDNGVVRFGFLGRLESVKNIPLLLNACRRMREDDSVWTLTVIGDGPLRRDLGKLVQRLNISDRIHFRGQSMTAMRDLEMVDVLVHPSASEGMSISILEAMGMGVPVIASSVGGNTECIVHGETGLLIPPGDEKALVEACRMLAGDSGFRQRLARGARRRVKSEFTIARMADEVLTSYCRILKDK